VWKKIRSRPAALDAVRKTLLNTPGIWRVFTADEVKRVSADDPAQRAAALSWHEERSGDMILVPQLYWIASAAATTHGTLHPYDQRVPLIFFGSGIDAGRRADAVSPADLAPTLAQVAGVRLKEPDGRSLSIARPVTASP
jgi:hypothetical protein